MIHNVDPQLSQWDVGRSVSVGTSNATHIHFANQGDSKAVIIEIKDGSAKIPDYLLQTGKTVIAYAVLNGITLESKSFPVRKRERPENYVYEDDQRNYIYELITSADTAVKNANLATESATTAATSANLASTKANEAAVSASVASESANLAAKSANEAAIKANNTAKSLMVIGGAEGSTIYLNDAIDQTLVGLRVFGKTTQDGTPTPDAPVEILSVENPVVGVYGKNLLTSYAESTKTENGITFTVNGNGSITINGTATGTAQFNMFALYELPPSVRPGETYMISGATSATAIHIFELHDNWVHKFSTTGKTTFVLSDDAKGVLIRYAVQPNVSVNNLTVYPMLRLASVADGAYEQSKPAQTIMLNHTLPGIPVTSGGNYTDANGQQWICDEIDFARGVYIQRVNRKTLNGAERWNYHTNNYVNQFYTIADDCYTNNSLVNALSKQLKGISLAERNNNYNTIYTADQGENRHICINIEGYSGQTEFAAYLKENPIDVIYRLFTPIETPLSEEELAAYSNLRTYKDSTTVSNDAGAWMALSYAMDAKKYIDQKISAGLLTATVE